MDPNIEDLTANSAINNYMACLFNYDHREGLTSITDFCSWAEHRKPTEQPTDVPCNRIRHRENKKKGKEKKKAQAQKTFKYYFGKGRKDDLLNTSTDERASRDQIYNNYYLY